MKKRLPFWFYIGLLLNVTAWIISWTHLRPFCYYMFFPLWFGFILILDGLNYAKSGESLMSKNIRSFFFLFLLSALFWWIFEIMVPSTKNWYYLSSKPLSVWESKLLGSLFFSTLIPAAFEISGLLKSFNVLGKKIKWIKLSKETPTTFFVVGIVAVALVSIWPNYFFPFLWMIGFFILDPINFWMGRDSLTKDAMKADWTRAFYLGLSMLVCGFFWEMWNFRADPKWVYEVPYVGFLKIFEMPLLGYLGYIPFAFELFVFYVFTQGLFKYPREGYVPLVAGVKARESLFWKAMISLLIVFTVAAGSMIKIDFNRNDEFLSADFYEQIDGSGEEFSGEIYLCACGSVSGNCLVTNSGDVFMLTNENGERIRFPLGQITLKGVVKELVVGMDELIIK
ncbi:hypothetical protein JW962_00075 [Candidatus Dojkabacteria bacterium]|nr:hypothetical protein [Candidatus Dojkabacteria bacterium]